MKPNKCMDCPYKQISFMRRTCELTGGNIPLFSEPKFCPTWLVYQLIAKLKKENEQTELNKVGSIPKQV